MLGPAGHPSTGSCRNPPHSQMPDAARAAVLAAPVASGPSWEAAAHALSLQKLCCNSDCSGARERFEDITRLLLLLPHCARRASHSPRIIVSASQSHQAGPLLISGVSGVSGDHCRSMGQSSTLPAHVITWFGCLQARDLGTLQRGWGHRDGPLLGRRHCPQASGLPDQGNRCPGSPGYTTAKGAVCPRQ